VATAEEWRARGVVAIQQLLEAELAITIPEMEAKLSDRRAGPADGRIRIQPHHLTTARQRLLRAGVIEQTKETTRGSGRTITTLSLSPRSKRTERAAARKRLLTARYMSWTTRAAEWGEAAPIPAALERVIHASLTEASPHGYRLVKPGGGEVDRLFNEKVPGGPLDNAAFYTGVDNDGLPITPVTVPIEAKNLRQWIYPRTQELFQLLDKGARLQQARPATPIVPVLVCRQMHPFTGAMARQMGFHVIPTWRQYVRPVVARFDETAQRKFEEVRDELGYVLEPHEGAVEPMVNQFTKVLPGRIEDASQRWGAICRNETVVDLLHALREEGLEYDERHEVVTELGHEVGKVLSEAVQWTGEAQEEPDNERDRGGEPPF
jgi:hypothetical protein